MPLANIKAVISDMDGVLWRGNTPLPGLVEFIEFLRSREIPFVLASNNSGRHPDQYLTKLVSLGVHDIRHWQIVSSGTTTADYLKAHYPAGTRIFVVGNAGLLQILEEAGFAIAEADVELVVAGIDFDFTYAKARQATSLIRAGATFIGCNPDLTFPTADGFAPGAGSIIKMLEVASDVQPLIMGKPERAMFDVARERLGSAAGETLMLGDRLSTDIDGGHRAGLQTALMLTGVNNRADAEQNGIQPDYIFADLPTLIEAWQI